MVVALIDTTAGPTASARSAKLGEAAAAAAVRHLDRAVGGARGPARDGQLQPSGQHHAEDDGAYDQQQSYELATSARSHRGEFLFFKKEGVDPPRPAPSSGSTDAAAALHTSMA